MTQTDLAKRREQVEQMLAILALDGFTPDATFMESLQPLLDGMPVEEYRAYVKKFYAERKDD